MAVAVKGGGLHLVIGLGQIGTALQRVLGRQYNVSGLDLGGKGPDPRRVDVLHIAIPYSDDFAKVVQDYMEVYHPFLTIVYSTLPIGTCEKVGSHVVHSPVEGKHPRLDKSILISPRWMGCSDDSSLEAALSVWQPLVEVVRTMQSSRFTEFLKLRSTAKYGVNLVWTDYEAGVANKLGVSWNAVKEFDQDYNYLYQDLGMPEYQRYILDPPGGVIGGHCIVPNAELLDAQYPHPLLKQIKRFKKGDKNEKHS